MITSSLPLLRVQGAKSCAALCSIILICAAAAAVAQSCPAGQGIIFEGSTECALCNAGEFQDVVNGVSKCVRCPQHSISTQKGATSCEPCAPGNATMGSGNSECMECDAGTQACTTQDCYGCAPCPAGMYTEHKGDSPCIECPLGNYINQDREDNEDMLSCTGCPAGSAAQNGSTASTKCHSSWYSLCCDICEPGTFTATAGQTQCERCPAGTYQSERNASSCTPCPPGSYSAEPGSTVCTPTSIGFYQPDQGGTKQLPCPAGTVGLVAGGTTVEATCLSYKTGRYKFTDRQFRLSIINIPSFGTTTAIEATADDDTQVMDSGSSTSCSGGVYDEVTVYTCNRNPYVNGVLDKSVCTSKPGDLSAMESSCSTYNFYALQNGSFAWVVYTGGFARTACTMSGSQNTAECKFSESVQSSTYLGEFIYFGSAQAASGQPSTNIEDGAPRPPSSAPNAATTATAATSLRSAALAMLGVLSLLCFWM